MNREHKLGLLAVCFVVIALFSCFVVFPSLFAPKPAHNVKNVFYTDQVLPIPHFISMNGHPLDGVISAVPPLSPVRMQINYTAFSPSGCDVSDAQPNVIWGYSCPNQVQTYYTTMNASFQTLTVRAAGIDTPLNVALMIPISQRLDRGNSGSLEAKVAVQVPLVTNILWRYNSTQQNVVIRPLAVYPYAIGNPDAKHLFEVVIDIAVSYRTSSVPDSDYPQFLLTTQHEWKSSQRGYGLNRVITVFQPVPFYYGPGEARYHYAAPAELDAQYFILVVNGIHNVAMNISVNALFIEYFLPMGA